MKEQRVYRVVAVAEFWAENDEAAIMIANKNAEYLGQNGGTVQELAEVLDTEGRERKVEL